MATTPAIPATRTSPHPWLVVTVIGALIIAVAMGIFVVTLFLTTTAKKAIEAKEEAKATQKAAAYAAVHPPALVVAPEYPTHGEGHVTTEKPIKAYLDPQKTYLRPSRAVRYVFVEDTTLSFDENYTGGLEPNSTPHRKVWLGMPAGKYLVYSLVEGKVYFCWWQ